MATAESQPVGSARAAPGRGEGSQGPGPQRVEAKDLSFGFRWLMENTRLGSLNGADLFRLIRLQKVSFGVLSKVRGGGNEPPLKLGLPRVVCLGFA